jgi:hypothetical protein
VGRVVLPRQRDDVGVRPVTISTGLTGLRVRICSW